MMARCLSLVLAGAFFVFVLMPAPAEAVCRPQCLDMNKKGAEVEIMTSVIGGSTVSIVTAASATLTVGENTPCTRTTVNIEATAVMKNRPSPNRR